MYGTHAYELICLQGFVFPYRHSWLKIYLGEKQWMICLIMYGLFFVDEFLQCPNVRIYNLWYLYVPSLDRQRKRSGISILETPFVCSNGFEVPAVEKRKSFFFSHTFRKPTSQDPSSKQPLPLQQLPRPGPHRTPHSKQSGDQIDLTPEGNPMIYLSHLWWSTD